MSQDVVFRATQRTEAKIDLLLNLFVRHIGEEKLERMILSDYEQKILNHALEFKEGDYHDKFFK